VQPETASVAAKSEINGSCWATHAKLHNDSTRLVPRGRPQWNADTTVWMAVTKDLIGESLSVCRKLDLEFRMVGRNEGCGVENELDIHSCGYCQFQD
jgi:hypothetical protein